MLYEQRPRVTVTDVTADTLSGPWAVRGTPLGPKTKLPGPWAGLGWVELRGGDVAADTCFRPLHPRSTLTAEAVRSSTRLYREYDHLDAPRPPPATTAVAPTVTNGLSHVADATSLTNFDTSTGASARRLPNLGWGSRPVTSRDVPRPHPPP